MMLSQIICITALVAVCVSQEAPLITREVSDGVRSLGYRVVYGDKDMSTINKVVDYIEKSNLVKSKKLLNNAIPVMPAEDVKCLMSVDQHCSKEMMKMKRKWFI